ncbi:MAG: SGNH/GDSL hydrolase family protein [Thermoanaerobaculia bacterium]
MAQISTRKKIAYSLVLLAFLWGLVELACLGGLWALRRYKNLEYQPKVVEELNDKHKGILAAQIADTSSYMVFDADLGWTIRPNGNKTQYKANSKGLRATREYPLQPPADKVRVAAFGDSFTHASGVPTGYTWEERLEAMQPGLEVINFGIPGSDPGQGLLRYRREGVQYRPGVVLIGFMSENINRMVNTFRPFYFPRSGLPFSKPRFALQGGKLVLIPNPVRSIEEYRRLLSDPERMIPRLGEHDYFYQRNNRRSRLDFLPSVRFARLIGRQYFNQPILLPGGQYNTRSEAYQVTFRVLDQFYREALGNGSVPFLVMFPQRKDVRLRHAGNPVTYQPLVDELRRRGYRVIDLADGFEHYDPRAKMAGKNFLHYPREGNEMAAQWVRDILVRQGLATRQGVRKALGETRAPALP